MKIFNKWEIKEIPEEERVNNVEGEEKTENKHIGRKILIGLGIAAAAVGGAVAIFGRKDDDEYDVNSLPEAGDVVDTDFEEVDSDE